MEKVRYVGGFDRVVVLWTDEMGGGESAPVKLGETLEVTPAQSKHLCLQVGNWETVKETKAAKGADS